MQRHSLKLPSQIHETSLQFPPSQFFVLLGLGIFLLFLSSLSLPFLMLNPTKFASLFTMGSGLCISSFATLRGFKKFSEHMWESKHRRFIVFVYFGSCGLICYDFEGNEVWLRRMRIPENMYGTAASPIVAKGRLIFLGDNATGSFLEAIEPATGETVWRKDRSGFTAGWSSPMCWSNGGIDEIVCYGVGWITAYALTDGAERWSTVLDGEVIAMAIARCTVPTPTARCTPPTFAAPVPTSCVTARET